ncbi:DUF416 family protein [Lysobacter firmicutimachus]|uniref:DUF416 family protein n=1 Tax=Lysobacter firmicutimachus TaxID=1792846 RepID=A0ABU8CYL3_9GAMM
MLREFRSEVLFALADAPHWKRASFMASCCEPMLANYRLYRREYKRGSVRALRQSLDELWNNALLDKPKRYSDQVLERVYRQSPPRIRIREMSPLEEVAFDTCSGIGFSMEYDGSQIGLEEVCNVALCTIVNANGGALSVNESDQPDIIRQLLQLEAHRQRRCFEQLVAASHDCRDSTVKSLRMVGANAHPSMLPPAIAFKGTDHDGC